MNKSRGRSPEHPGYRGYMLSEIGRNIVAAGATRHAFDLSLNDLETELTWWQSVPSGHSAIRAPSGKS
jgi:hypothetical protein